MALEGPDELTPVCVVETDGLAIATGDQSLAVADRHDGGGGAGPDGLLLHPCLPVPDTHRLRKITQTLKIMVSDQYWNKLFH